MTIYPSLTKICSKCKLCSDCNSVLGYAKDSIESLQEAINYLNKYKHG